MYQIISNMDQSPISEGVRILRTDILRKRKDTPSITKRISENEFVVFDSLRLRKDFTDWYAGKNPTTGRKIQINGKVHNEIRSRNNFSSYDYYQSLEKIENRIDYLQKSEQLHKEYIDNKQNIDEIQIFKISGTKYVHYNGMILLNFRVIIMEYLQ